MAKFERKTFASQQIRNQKPLTNIFPIHFGPLNYILLAVSILMLIVGFYIMSQGAWDSSQSVVVAPIILFIAFVVLIPVSIFVKSKKEVVAKEETAEE